ncbi:MAG: efflux transporter outer membrane subunit [Burkholderiales bacterium]|nr:efflux transporter outer membrane subunit [Burkholderiales bacterium]
MIVRKRHAVLARSLPALLAVAVAGCANFDPLPPPQVAIDAAALGARDVAAPWPADLWWRRYGDAQLDALIADGIAGSPTLAAARARVVRADAAAGVARAALVPQVTGNAAVNEQKYSGNFIYPPPLAGAWKSDARATIDLVFEFDFWDKNGAALRAALSQAQAAAADAQAARLVLATSIAQAYFELQRLLAQQAVSRDAIAQRAEIVRITSERFTAGLDTKVEVRQAEAALGTVRTELAQYDEAIGIARNRLAALVGAGPARGEGIVAAAPTGAPASALPTAIPLDLAGRRPDIVAARWRVEAAREEVNVARAQFYPNVNVVAFAGLTSLGVSNLLLGSSSIAGVGPALHLPIFEGGRLNANLAGRSADADLAIAAYNQALVDAVGDVANAVTSIRGLARTSDEQARARSATNQAYDLAVIRYRAGLGNYLTVLTAQTQQLVQDRLDVDLKARAYVLDVNLVRALGGGYLEPAPAALAATGR